MDLERQTKQKGGGETNRGGGLKWRYGEKVGRLQDSEEGSSRRKNRSASRWTGGEAEVFEGGGTLRIVGGKLSVYHGMKRKDGFTYRKEGLMENGQQGVGRFRWRRRRREMKGISGRDTFGPKP